MVTKLSPEGLRLGGLFWDFAVLLPVVTVKPPADKFNKQTRFDGDK